MTAGSTCVFIAEVSSVLSFSFWMHWLLVLIFGLGIGVTTCTTLIYMAEIVPLSHRGVMASEWYPYATCSKAIMACLFDQ